MSMVVLALWSSSTPPASWLSRILVHRCQQMTACLQRNGTSWVPVAILWSILFLERMAIAHQKVRGCTWRNLALNTIWVQCTINVEVPLLLPGQGNARHQSFQTKSWTPRSQILVPGLTVQSLAIHGEKQGDRKSAIPKYRLVQESSVFRPVGKYSVALMMYLFPRAVSGRGPIRSIPIHFRTYETGIGCSSGHCLSNLLFTRWQVSHLLQNSATSFPTTSISITAISEGITTVSFRASDKPVCKTSWWTDWPDVLNGQFGLCSMHLTRVHTNCT